MLSFDTNIMVHSANNKSLLQAAAKQFLADLTPRSDVVVCELMLVECYLKLRNGHIFEVPLTAGQAAAACQNFRYHPRWRLIESAPVMDKVWQFAAQRFFAIRRIVDVRMALTLQAAGVTEFATTNVKDFENLGFKRVWNPFSA